MTLSTEEDTLIWRRKLWNAICGGIVLEEDLNLSSDRLLEDDDDCGWINSMLRSIHPWWALDRILEGHGNGIDVLAQGMGRAIKASLSIKTICTKNTRRKLLYVVSNASYFRKASLFLRHATKSIKYTLGYLLGLPWGKSAVNTLRLPLNLTNVLMLAFVLCDRRFRVLWEINCLQSQPTYLTTNTKKKTSDFLLLQSIIQC